MAWPDQNKKKKHGKKNRNTKKLLVFDENARREYLTGFRKRKDERRRVAAENLLQEMKEEKKKLKQQVKDMMKSRVDNQSSVPEVKHLLDPQIFDLPSHTVTVTDVSEVDLSGQNGLILGQNTFHETVPQKDTDEDKTEPKKKDGDIKEVKKLKRKMAKIELSNLKKLKGTKKKSSKGKLKSKHRSKR